MSVCVCVCVCVCVLGGKTSLVKTTERGLRSHIRRTTKLTGVTWEIPLERLQQMPNVTWRSHARTWIRRRCFRFCWIRYPKFKIAAMCIDQRWSLHEHTKFEQRWRLRSLWLCVQFNCTWAGAEWQSGRSETFPVGRLMNFCANQPTDYSERPWDIRGSSNLLTFKFSAKISKIYYIRMKSNQYLYHLLTLYISSWLPCTYLWSLPSIYWCYLNLKVRSEFSCWILVPQGLFIRPLIESENDILWSHTVARLNKLSTEWISMNELLSVTTQLAHSTVNHKWQSLHSKYKHNQNMLYTICYCSNKSLLLWSLIAISVSRLTRNANLFWKRAQDQL